MPAAISRPIRLEDLYADVAISSPTNGQTLVYDSSSGKWVNASGSLAIGDAIGGSPTDYGILLVDGSGNLAQVSGLGTSGEVLTSNGASVLPTWQVSSSGTPPGSDTDVIYNKTGVLGADANLTWDYTNQRLVIAGMSGFQTLAVSNGSYQLDACNTLANHALLLQDGTNTVALCNGSQSLKDTTGTWSILSVPYQWPNSQGGASTNLVNDGTGILSWGSGGGSLAIGDAVGGSPTDYGVLLVDSSGNLAQVSGLGTLGEVLTSNGAGSLPTWQVAGTGAAPGSDTQLIFNQGGSLGTSANLSYDYTNGSIVTNSITSSYPALWTIDSSIGYVAKLSTSTLGAGWFSDGPRTVTLCDGTNHVLYDAGAPGDWASTSPTDLWIAVDRLAAWITANATVFGTLGITTQP